MNNYMLNYISVNQQYFNFSIIILLNKNLKK